MPTFRILAIGLFWILCLAGGLWLGETYAPQPVVLVIPIERTIDSILAEYVEEKLTQAVEDRAVAAIVLSVNSPGGGAISGERIYHAVLQARQSKPVVVVVSGIALSAGYFIAVASHAIYAPAVSEVGNIGTRGPSPQDPIFRNDELISGPYKLNEARFEAIRRLGLDTDTFAVTVLHHRQRAPNPLKISLVEMREGRAYLGREALGLGLIDAIGGRGDAVKAAATLAGLRNYTTRDAELPNVWFVRRNPLFFQAGEEATPAPSSEEGK